MGIETEEISNSAKALPEGNATHRRPRETFTYLYEGFRRSGLSKLDSAFNALYICQTNKMCRKKINTDDVGEGFFSHPAGWYKSGRERVRRAAKTRTLKFLELMAKVIAPFTSSRRKKSESGFFADSSKGVIENVARSFKKHIPSTAVALSALFLLLTIYFAGESRTVIEVRVDGDKVGEVLSSETIEEALDRVNSRMSSITGEAFSFPHELSFKSKRTLSDDTLDVNGLYELLSTYTDKYVVEGYGLYIDSLLVAVLDNREDIIGVLDELCLEHMEISGEEENIANSVEIKYQEYSLDSLVDAQTLHDMLAHCEEEVPAERTVSALLSPSTSSATLTIDANATELEEKIAEAISSFESEREDAPRLDFAVYYEETVRESVPYTTSYISDADFYENQEFVQVYGRNGLADNTYRVKYVNGVEDSREIIEQSFLRLPRESVVRVGTRKLPERMTEKENGGKYMINPVPTARVSDHFGQRILKGRSDYHEGLDLAAWTGTPIYAAASGEVIYAAYSASYGYVVKILHDDGLVSVYAHCSKLLVSLGDLVSQADEIALVGSTGYSFGYHCHFEVIKDGVKVDPEDYIYSLD